jgi:Rrf2 family protein
MRARDPRGLGGRNRLIDPCSRKNPLYDPRPSASGRSLSPGPIRLDDIAQTQNIPRKFLTVILSEMVREGVVISHRGREGGYELALPPCDLRYGDIIRLTRGSLALVPCASRYAHEHCTNCLPEVECRLRGLMLALRDEMAAMLDRLTLADPIEVEAPSSNHLIYLDLLGQ